MKKIISLVLVGVVAVGGLLYLKTLSPALSQGEGASAQVRYDTKTGAIPLSNGEGLGERVSGVKIIAIGDSLTAGYGLNLDESYPKQLEKKLLENNYNVQIINAGVSGETTAGLLERIEFIKKQNPEIVLITIGGNDALRALPVLETEKNILKIVQSLKEVVDKEKVFLMHIQAPANLGFTYTREFNSLYSKIAKLENIKLVPFVQSEIFTNQRFMQNDGIHPNEDGYRFIVENYLYPEVVKVFK